MGESRSFNIEILREGKWFVARCVDNIEFASQGAHYGPTPQPTSLRLLSSISKSRRDEQPLLFVSTTCWARSSSCAKRVRRFAW